MATGDIRQDEFGNKFRWNGSEFVPFEDLSTLQAIGIGAGESFTTTGRGIQQIFNSIRGGQAGREANEALAARQAGDQQAFREGVGETNPIATGIGQALPFVAAAPLGGSSVAGQVALEAGLGGLGFGDVGERAERAAIGAGAAFGGNMVLRVANGIRRSSQAITGRGVDPVTGAPAGSAGAARVEGSVVGTGSQSGTRSALQNAGRQIVGEGIDSPADLQAMITLRENGFRLSPGTASGNAAARGLNSFVENAPLLKDIPQAAIAAPNAQDFNRMTLDALGENVPEGQVAEFTADSIGALKRKTGDIVEGIKEQTPTIEVSDGVIRRIEGKQDTFSKEVTTISAEDPAVKVVDNVLAEIKDGKLSTDTYTRIRSRVRGAQIKASEQNEVARAELYSSVIEDLDAAFAQSIGDPTEFAKFQVATQRFRLLEALDKPGVISPQGDINVPALNRNLKKIFKAEYGDADRFGTFAEMPEFGKLFDVSKALGRFPKIAGGSPTFERLSAQSLFSNPVQTTAQLGFRPLLRNLIEGAQPSADELRDLQQLF